jgi:YVTN family beta-propeller protein
MIAVARILLTLFIVFAVAPQALAQPYAYISAVRVPIQGGSSIGQQTLVVVNTQTNARVATVPLETTAASTAEAIAASPGLARLYVANQISGTISILDTTTNVLIGSVFVGAQTAGDRMALAVSPDGARLYVLNRNQILVVATDSASVIATIPLGPTTAGFGMSMSPDGARLYVADFLFSLKVVDVASRSVVASVPLPDRPISIDVTPDGGAVYLAGGGSNAVFVVSTAANALVATIGIGSYAGGVRVTPDGSRVYVVTIDALRIIDRGSNSVTGTVTGVLNPRQLDFTPDGTRAYVSVLGGTTVVNTITGAVTGFIPILVNGDGTSYAVRIPSPPLPPPGPPANLRTASIVGNTVSLQWDAPLSGTPPNSYRIEGGVAPGQVLATLPTGSANPSFSFIAPDGSFFVRVHAFAGAVRGPASNEIQITVPGACAPPLSPVNFVASKSGNTVTVTWEPSPAGPPATGYVLNVGGAFAGSFTTPGRSLSGTVGPGTYVLTVAATNACGASSATPSQSVTVP